MWLYLLPAAASRQEGVLRALHTATQDRGSRDDYNRLQQLSYSSHTHCTCVCKQHESSLFRSLSSRGTFLDIPCMSAGLRIRPALSYQLTCRPHYTQKQKCQPLPKTSCSLRIGSVQTLAGGMQAACSGASPLDP